MNLTIFDIKRFSTHDGEGIRTTIFLKGCPLRCVWCQNPEGIDAARRVVFFENRCIRCRECERADKADVVRWIDDMPRFNREIDETFYSEIIDRCPSGAIRMDSSRYTAEQLMEIIRKDIPFYRETGGVTFSGGEPLVQGKGIGEIAEKCRLEGIRTAIETTLFAPYSEIEPLFDQLDAIYVDLKLSDDEQHKKYTGVSNRLICENIRKLLSSEQREKVVIRTPLIPLYTATEANIRGIARFIRSCNPQVKYELLNYNPLASAKYPLVGQTYCFDTPVSPFSRDELIDTFGRYARDEGIENMLESHHKRG